MHINRRHTDSNTRGYTFARGWTHKKEEVEHSMRQYWPIKDKLVMIDDTSMKDKRIIIPFNCRNRYYSSCTETI